MKIYERILERKIWTRGGYKLNESQHGLRPGKETANLTVSLKKMIEERWGMDTEVCVAFANLVKAFDSAPRAYL